MTADSLAKFTKSEPEIPRHFEEPPFEVRQFIEYDSIGMQVENYMD